VIRNYRDLSTETGSRILSTKGGVNEAKGDSPFRSGSGGMGRSEAKSDLAKRRPLTSEGRQPLSLDLGALSYQKGAFLRHIP
jgi:hypothetical protein